MVKHLLQMRGICLTVVLSFLMINVQYVSADGSKDMYPEDYFSRYGVPTPTAQNIPIGAYRACLMSGIPSGNSDPNPSVPFPTYGTIKVYAKAGEHIYMASSAMVVKTTSSKETYGRIDWRAPDGTKGSVTDIRRGGLIANRTEELAGPNINGSTAGYDAYKITVGADQEGVWEIDFVAATTNLNFSTETPSNHTINNWTENLNRPYINAFDVSVSNEADDAFIKGRVYANVLNLMMPSSYQNTNYSCEWYTTLYVLTNTGYLYEVKPNGQNGHFSTFFANNKGIQTDPLGWITDNADYSSSKAIPCYGGFASYKSVDASLSNSHFVDNKVPIYDPRRPDMESKRMVEGEEKTTDDVTHKIFFCIPSSDLPASARAVYGKKVETTWLLTSLNAEDAPLISNLSLVGKESHLEGVLGPEGVNIHFDANASGDFLIEMIFGAGYENRILSGYCEKGRNVIEWDGLDGNGKAVPVVNISLAGKLKSAEIHFPFFDLENNKNGLLLNQLNAEWTAVERDSIYWDDSSLTGLGTVSSAEDPLSMTEGTKSPGHKWLYRNSNRGNNRIIDTWTFAQGASRGVQNLSAYSRYIDLGIRSVTCDTNVAHVGEIVSYTLEVVNKAMGKVKYGEDSVIVDSDADSASVGVWFPTGGFVTTSVELLDSDDPTCRVARQPSSAEFGLGFISLKNGKQATLRVSGYATAHMAHNSMRPIGFIMRPGDFFEVDAKNLASDGMPLNPLNEYEGIENDNVMVANRSVFLLNTAPDASANDTIVPAGRSVSGNLLNNDKDVDNDEINVSGYMVNGVMGTLDVPMTILKEGQTCGEFQMGADGSYTFTADASYAGMVPDIYYAVSDGFTGNTSYEGTDLIPGRDTSRFNIQVLPNHLPAVTPTSVTINRSGNRTWLPIIISDEDGDPLTLSLSGSDAAWYEVAGDSVYYVGGPVSTETVSHFDLTVDDGVREPVVTPITVTIKVNQAPTLSPEEVTITVRMRQTADYLLPVVISDPDGDEVTASISNMSSSYFTYTDGKLYFNAVGGATGNVRSAGTFPHNVTMTLTDDKGASNQVTVKINISVVNHEITPSNAYAYADNIYYGSPLSEALSYGADCEGTWSLRDSVAGLVDTTEVLQAGLHSIDLLFSPSSSNYLVEEVKSIRFNVLPRPITLVSGSAEKTYDGEALSMPTVSVESGSFLGEEQFSYNNFASLTGADTIDNTFSYAATAGTSLENYNVTVRYGSLVVTPRPITISSSDSTKSYDGTPLSNPTVNVIAGSFAGSDAFVYSNFATITEMGSVDNTFSYAPAPGVTLANYVVTTNYGKLTVEPFMWTGDYDINLSETNYMYEGTEHRPSATISAIGYTLDENFFDVKYENNIHAGDSAMVIISPKENSSIQFKTDTAFFSIAKRSITIKSSSCEQVYNGRALSCHMIESVTGDGMAAGESFALEYTDSLTNVGTVDNVFQVSIDERDYNVTRQYGTLTVKPKQVTLSNANVTWSDASFPYDGQAHCPTATITVDRLELDPDHDYTISCADNVAVGENSAVATVKKAEHGNFDFSDYEAHFSIQPAVVTITDKSVASKTYDGTTSATVTVNGITGLVSGDDVDVEVTASFADANAGTNKDVEISYALIGADKDNYRLSVNHETYPYGEISPLVATLVWNGEAQIAYDGTPKRVEATVTNAIGTDVVAVESYRGNEATEIGSYVARALSLNNTNYTLPDDASFNWYILPMLVNADVTVENVSFTYDQTAHEPGVVVKVGENILTDSDYYVDYKNNVDAGDSAMAIVSRKNGGIYFFDRDTVYFSIGKRAVTFRSDSCEKIYDGTPLTCETAFIVDSSQVLPGDTYTVTFSGSQTNVGKSDNTFNVVFDKDNYQVDLQYGQLKVSPMPIDILPSDIVWDDTVFIYDGTEHCPTATITVNGNVLNPMSDYKIVCDNNVKVGSDVAHIAVKSQDGGNFLFTDYEVNFSILPVVISITDSTVFEKTFDGGNAATVKVNAVSFKAPGDSIEVTTAAKFNNASAGTNKKVSITYGLAGPDKDNYVLAYNTAVYNKGVINKREAILVWNTPDTFVYDGLKHGVSATVEMDIHVSAIEVTGYTGDSAIEAGRYVARATGVNNRNFKLPENDSLVWVILPSGIDASSFTLQQSSVTYDAMSHPATFNTDSALHFTQDVDYTISYKAEGTDSTAWNTFPPINAGVYDIKISVHNPNYEQVDLTGWQMTIGKAPITVTPNVTKAKVYDRTTDATVSLESLSGVVGNEDVSVSIVAQYDTFTTEASSIRSVYSLTGGDAMNYYLSDSVDVSEGTILPLQLTVVGTTILDKSYDGTLDAVAAVGTLQSVISPDVVNVSVSSAYFSSDTIGDGTDVYVTYRLSGQDAANYTVKPDTVKGNILEPAISFTWSVKDTVYGMAIVGKNPLVEVNQTVEGTLIYFVDGLPVDTGYVIPAGEHTLLAQFTSSEGGFAIPSGGESISVSKKYVTLASYDINPIKPYDGTDTVLSLKTDSTLVGVVMDDDVRLASLNAHYENAQVSSSKTIIVNFSLMGNDTANYAIEEEQLRGAIRKRQVQLAAGDSTKVYDGTPLRYDTVFVIGDGFIEGDLVSAHATGEITEPGHVLNKVVFVYANDSIEDNYEIVIARGFLVITKIPQEAPTIVPVNESILGLNDGQLLGLTTEMEMRDEHTSTYAMVTRTDSLYAPGTYYVRFPESQYYAASDSQEVIILPGPGEFIVSASSADTARGSVTGSGTYLYQSDVTVEALPNTGYHFVAWNDTILENPYTFVLTGDTSFAATFEPNQYQIFVMDRGVSLDSLSVLFGDTVVEAMLSVTPQREGYDFNGWSPAFPIVMGASDVTVEAQWKIKLFNVEVDSLTEGGKVNTNFTNPVAYGDTVVLNALSAVGYHFTSWNDGDVTNPRRVVVTSDTSFSPRFEPNQHVLSVVSDGMTLDSITIVYGETITDSKINVALSKAGHYFTGWAPALPVVAGDSDMTIVAQWTKSAYIVTVDSMSAEGYTTTDFANPVAYEDTVTLTANPFNGYHFISWNDGDTINPREVVVTSDTSFSPLYGKNKYILYVMSDDSIVDSLVISFKETIHESWLKPIEKEGYDFIGWEPTLPVVMGDSNMTIVAQWKAKTYIVSVDSLTDKGTFVTYFTNPVSYGASVSLKAVPINGYHFVSWTDGTTLNPRKCTIHSDTFFAAIFEPNQYDVIVMSDSDTLRTVPVLFGDTVTTDLMGSSPEKEGHLFAGWSPVLPVVMGDSNMTVTAQWTKRMYIVSVDSLTVGGGVSTDFTNPVAYGDTVTLTAEPAEGYHFMTWDDGSAANPRQVVVASDTSFAPLFETNQYVVSVLSEGDTLKRFSISYGDTIVEAMLDVEPSSVGYNFVGWQPALPIVMGAADLTIEAQFQRKTIELTFDTLFENGSIITDFTNPVTYGDKITLTAEPAEGYHFVAWNDSVTTNPREVVVTSDTSLTPIFEPNLYHLIAMSEDTIVLTLPVHYGDTVQSSSVEVSLERTGYDFTGWLPNLPIVMEAGDMTIEAQWTKKTIELTLDTLFENGKVIADFQNPVTYGDTITLAVEPNEGYHFLSWADGDTLNPRQIVVVSDTSLTPIFMPNTYVFAALLDGDTLLKINVTYGDIITDSLVNIIPEKEGHDFIGWYPTLPIEVGASDLTLEAQWEKKRYHVVVTASANGTIDYTLGDSIPYGDTITFAAVPDEGFRFTSWTDGGRSNPRSVVVTSDTSFTASFSPNVYYVNVVNGDDTLAVLPHHFKDMILRKSLDSLNPTKIGHDFVAWDAEFPLSMPSHDTTITAIYTPKIFTVIAKINGNVGKVTGEGDYPYGTVVSLQAIPNEGFHFVKWGDGDTSSIISFTISSDTIASTLFAKDVDEMMVDTLIIPSFGYCPNTEDVIRYSLLNSEAPSEYRIIFSEEALQAGFADVDFTKINADNEVKVVIPDCPAGTYKASIQFKNAINSVTPFFDVDLRVNLSSDYITDIWQDVVSVINTENIFREYQWFHNDVRVGGATLPYYCEKKGLSGSYYLETVTTDGRQLRTCKKWFDNGTNTILSVYPNPTSDNATVELSVDNGSVHKLTVTNASGVIVHNTTFVGRKTQVSFRELPSGAYIVEVDGLTVKEIRK